MAQNRKFQDFVESKYVAPGGIATGDLADLAVSTGKIANDAVVDSKIGGLLMQTQKYIYDGSSKTTGAKTLVGPSGAQQLPAGAIVHSFMINPQPAFASSGSATIALGITGGASNFLGATAFDNAALVQASSHFRHPATSSIIGGATNVLLTIGGAAITDGACEVFISFMIPA